jgi:hypothetical protein
LTSAKVEGQRDHVPDLDERVKAMVGQYPYVRTD